MSWHRLALLMLAAGLLQMAVAPFLRFSAWWPIGARPDFLLALALAVVALAADQTLAFVGACLCGLLHDLLVGERPGVSGLLFAAIFWPAHKLRVRWLNRPLLRQLSLFLLCFALFALRPLLEEGRRADILTLSSLRSAIAGSLLVFLTAPLFGLFLQKNAKGD